MDIINAIDLSWHSIGKFIGIVNTVDFKQVRVPVIDRVDRSAYGPAIFTGTI